MPKVTKKEGLELLLMAWKEYDVAVYWEYWYSQLARIFQFIVLLLSVVIIVFTVLYSQSCGNEDDENLEQLGVNLEQLGINRDLLVNMTMGDDCLQISMDESHMLGIIFSLSLAMSFVLSLDAYLIPSSRALHLKSGAAELESIIWLYRAPARNECRLWLARLRVTRHSRSPLPGLSHVAP